VKRIEFLKNRWVASGKIAASAKLDHSLQAGDEVFDLLFKADPTPKKIYVDFVLRCYSNREFLVEDIERIADTLTVFHANKRRLPVVQRDIGTYASERDVWATLSNAGIGEEVESGKEIKRSDRNRAHLESEVIHVHGWTMAVLKTAFSARWWGIGTRWCTTEKTGETFQHYATRGNLRVFVSPDGTKHQLHIATGSLCDATDRPVSLGKYLSSLPEAFLVGIREDVAAAFGGFDLNDEHAFIYLHSALLALPKHFFATETSAVFARLKDAGLSNLKLVAHEDGWTLKLARGDFSSWAIRYDLGQPYDLSKDRNMPLARLEGPDGVAVSVDFARGSLKPISALVQRMPKTFREAFLARCVKSWQGWDEEVGHEIDAVLRSVPPSELSPTFWKAWVKKISGEAARSMSESGTFGFVPDEAMTLELAHVFARKGQKHRIPDGMITDGVAKELAKFDVAFLDDPEVAGVLSKKQLANVFGARNGDNLKNLPVEHRTAEMIRLVVGECAGALAPAVKMVRAGLIELGGTSCDDLVRELTMNSLSSRAASLSDVTIPLPREVYLDVVKRGGAMLAWVPLEYRDVELCTAAIIDGHTEGLCHFPAWVVQEIRDANGGLHGITHNYRPSLKYAHVLKALEKPSGSTPEALPPFRISAVAIIPARRG
jgi:hypothetical protein